MNKEPDMSKTTLSEQGNLRGVSEFAEGNSHTLSGVNEAVALARAGATEMVRVLLDVARGSGSKPASAYVRARAAACVLEVCGLVKSGPTAQVSPDDDAA